MIYLILLLLYPFFLIGLPLLKLLGAIDLGWAWVLAPVWLPILIFVITMAPFALILIGLALV